jgi:hypothetical protein
LQKDHFFKAQILNKAKSVMYREELEDEQNPKEKDRI